MTYSGKLKFRRTVGKARFLINLLTLAPLVIYLVIPLHPVALPGKGIGPSAIVTEHHGDTLYTIDRLKDGGWAVLEDSAGLVFDVPAHWLPENAKGGDVLLVDHGNDGGSLTFIVDQETTRQRLARAGELLRNRAKGPSGDLEL